MVMRGSCLRARFGSVGVEVVDAKRCGVDALWPNEGEDTP